jgi:HPt (histidine-containing phosphotransfer) domain-containing protein
MIANYAMKIDVRTPFIDDSVLNEIRDFMGEEGDAIVAELLMIYLNNTPRALQQIGEDLKTGDMVALKMHVHGLKGSSAGIGAVGISNNCKAIEEAMLAGQLAKVHELYESTLDIYRQVETDFRERL